ncbi:MAG: DUF488 domain-containing protein [Patescibacteria group bacterium]
MTPAPKRKILTIGHSNLDFKNFLLLLRKNGIRRIADVRSMPNSKTYPHFGQKALSNLLKKSGIEYFHIKELGGYRKPKKNSSNLGWENISFRGYADYMESPEFESGLNQLEEIAKEKPTAIMCAEAKPMYCHRILISDALSVRKWKIYHIKNGGKPLLHKPTPFLRVRRGKIIYPYIKA